MAKKKITKDEVLEMLKNYNGDNNYLINIRYLYLNNPSFSLTDSQIEYITSFSETKPKVARKWVELDSYYARMIADDKLLVNIPNKMWVEKLLVEKEKSYHIFGRFFENDKLNLYWIPKDAIVVDKTNKNVVVDFDKYSHRKPFKHQEEAIIKLLENDKFILALDMGLGKTSAAIIASIEAKPSKTLIICPASLKQNWEREIRNYTDKPIYICEGKKYDDSADYVIINYDIIKNFHSLKSKEETIIQKSKFDLVIIDECFTYDAKIMTENGEMNIGYIVENAIDVKILSYNINENKLEYKKINRWICKHKEIIYKLKLNNDIVIECTSNHKFYVKNKGYVEARNLTKSDKLYVLPKGIDKKTNNKEGKVLFSTMCSNYEKQTQTKDCERKTIQKNMPQLWCDYGVYNRNQNEGQNLLFKKMCKQYNSKKSRSQREKKRNYKQKWRLVKFYEEKTYIKSKYSKNGIRKNEKKQSYVKSRFCRKNETKINRKRISSSWGQWKNNKTTRNSIQFTRGWLDYGICNKHKGCERKIQQNTIQLQNRYSQSRFENIHRDRWYESQIKEKNGVRFEENSSFEFTWVESIEILEQGSYDKSTNVPSKNTRVYDLEISDNHNYFANSILVSNCHYIKNPQASRTKLINDVCKDINKIWLLTGTPLTSRPIDYFNLLSLIDSPVARNWMSYVIRYCAGYQFTVGFNKVWNVNGASNLDELRERTAPILLRKLKEDVLDLPEKIITPVYLRLKSKEYEDVMGEYFDWIKNNPKESKSLSVQFTKLMKVRQIIADEKIKNTIELIENTLQQERKVIVFSNFTNSLNKIYEHFKKIAVKLDGSSSMKQRQDSVDKFQNEDKIKVFIGNIKAAGVGLTLTRGDVVIFNDLSFVPADHSQAEDRAYRIGQKNSVSVLYPIFENTIEGIIYDMLDRKKKIISTVLGDNLMEEEASEDILTQILNFGK